MLSPHWLFRMSQWARNPPSAKRVKLAAGVIVIVLVIVGIEWLGYWPDWATAQRIPRGF